MGIAIVPTYPQERRALFNDWQNQATTEMTTVEKWMTEGYLLKDKNTGTGKTPRGDEDHNWVCVSKFEGVGCNDIDDLEACKKPGYARRCRRDSPWTHHRVDSMSPSCMTTAPVSWATQRGNRVRKTEKKKGIRIQRTQRSVVCAVAIP